MGTGIAPVASKFGKIPYTQIVDISEENCKKSSLFIEKLLEKEVSKGRCYS